MHGTENCFTYGIDCVAKQCQEQWLVQFILNVKLFFIPFLLHWESYSRLVLLVLVSIILYVYLVSKFFLVCMKLPLSL